MSRRPAAPLLAALAGLAALAALGALAAGCDGTPAARPAAVGTSPAPAGTGTASPGTASPGTASPGTASPGTASPGTGTAGPGRPAPAYRTVAPPAEPPGRFAGGTPPGPAAWVARLWFGGVPVDRDAARLVVAYAAVEIASDGTRTVAHAKLALFRCARRQGAGSPNFVGCTDRRVEYGDLAAPALRVSRTPAGGYTVAGTVTTYSYGTAVDRGVGLPARWTGRAFPIRVNCAPDPQPVCRPGRRGGGTAVFLGPDAGVAGRAGLDYGYLNRLSR